MLFFLGITWRHFSLLLASNINLFPCDPPDLFLISLCEILLFFGLFLSLICFVFHIFLSLVHLFSCFLFFVVVRFFLTDFSKLSFFLRFLIEFVLSFVHLLIGSFGPIFALVVLLLLHLFMRSFPFVLAVLASSFVERIPNSYLTMPPISFKRYETCLWQFDLLLQTW